VEELVDVEVECEIEEHEICVYDPHWSLWDYGVGVHDL
jgi:hypothetical protein